MSEETVRQLVARRAAFDAPVTAFAAFAEGRPVAHLDLRRRDGVAEIDNVGTLPDHRNHGYARALVLHAIARARSQGDDLIFLLADAEDWPRELYAKLGFGVIGEIHELHRPVP
jgi:ribosomal protein S18 acetylase RimI-like enzyme